MHLMGNVSVVCVRLAQLVRYLTANQKIPGSIPRLVEDKTLEDLLLPHRSWAGTLSLGLVS